MNYLYNDITNEISVKILLSDKIIGKWKYPFVDVNKRKSCKLKNNLKKIPAIEEFIQNTGAIIHYHSILDTGGYARSHDVILMPYACFLRGNKNLNPSESWYSMILHEILHWSGRENRLNRLRNFKTKKAWMKNYILEEFTAEIGSIFLCHQLGLITEIKDDSIQYMKIYYKLKKKYDIKYNIIEKASGRAMKAVEYLNSLQTK